MKGPKLEGGLGFKWCSECEYHLRCEECAAKDVLRILREGKGNNVDRDTESYIMRRKPAGWENVKDRLPTAYEDVLIWSEKYGYEIAFYDPDTDSWMNEGIFVRVGDRTWWRPLPDAPKEDL